MIFHLVVAVYKLPSLPGRGWGRVETIEHVPPLERLTPLP